MIYKLLISIALFPLIYFAIALVLVLSQRPQSFAPQDGLDFSGLLGASFDTPVDDPHFERGTYKARDGVNLPVTRVSAPERADVPLVIMVHGSGWHGGQFDQLAWKLRDVAELRAVTLRGHGETPQRRGDVDYIGQLEDDLADLIDQETARPVVLLGHSSGGGLVVRFAGGAHRDKIAGAVLLAPFLKYNAPTMRANSGGWTKALTRRLAGLSMLNGAKVTALNHLTAIQFNMPRAVIDGPQGHMATLAYSYRLNASYAPRDDYLADIAALPKFLLIAGREDEAFQATEFEPLMSSVTDKGRYVLVDGTSHLDVVDAAETETAIREMLREL